MKGDFLDLLTFGFDQPIPAPERLQSTVNAVAAQVGVTPAPTALIDPTMRGINAYANWRERANGEREYGIFFPINWDSVFHGENLRTVIAHELGHIANGDLPKKRKFFHAREYKADAFAASHGFNVAGLLAMSPSEEDSDTHPSKYHRMARVRRVKPLESK